MLSATSNTKNNQPRQTPRFTTNTNSYPLLLSSIHMKTPFSLIIFIFIIRKRHTYNFNSLLSLSWTWDHYGIDKHQKWMLPNRFLEDSRKGFFVIVFLVFILLDPICFDVMIFFSCSCQLRHQRRDKVELDCLQKCLTIFVYF